MSGPSVSLTSRSNKSVQITSCSGFSTLWIPFSKRTTFTRVQLKIMVVSFNLWLLKTPLLHYWLSETNTYAINRNLNQILKFGLRQLTASCSIITCWTYYLKMNFSWKKQSRSSLITWLSQLSNRSLNEHSQRGKWLALFTHIQKLMRLRMLLISTYGIW